MRHQKKLKKLGLAKDHRTSLLRNLIASLVLNGRIRTTRSRAKALAARFDHMISVMKKKEKREAIRLMPRYCNITLASQKIITDLLPKYAARTSGLTRITRIGMRKGDNASLVQIELL